MKNYTLPQLDKPAQAGKNDVLLVANGDLRLSANQKCWPAQKEMEAALTKAVASCGYKLVRAHRYDRRNQHQYHYGLSHETNWSGAGNRIGPQNGCRK